MIQAIRAKLGIEARAVAMTAAALLVERGARLVIGFVVTGVVARHLGVTLFGQLSYGLALGAIVAGLGQLGLDSILIREFARRPAAAMELIVTGGVMRLLATLVCWVATMAIVVSTPLPAGAPSIGVIAVLSLTAIQAVSSVPTFWLQTHGRAWQSTAALLVVFVAASIARVTVVMHGAGLVSLGWIAVVELLLSGVLTLWQAAVSAEGSWRFAPGIARELWHDGWPLAVAAIAYLGYTRFDQLLVGSLASQDELGMYAAALRLTEQSYLLPAVLATPMLGLIARLGDDTAAIRLRTGRYLAVSALLAYAFVVFVWVAAPWLYPSVFGRAYTAAISLARIQVWMAPLIAVGVARNQILISEGRTLFALAAAVAGFTVNIVLNLLLIPRFGATGASWAGLAAQGLSLVVSSWASRSLWWVARLQLISLLAPWRLIRRGPSVSWQ